MNATSIVPDGPPSGGILLRLVGLRYAVALLLVVALVATRFATGVDPPWGPLAVSLVLLLAVYGALHARVKAGRTVSEREVFASFAVEVLVLTAILRLAGGAASPLVSLYLLPLTMAANLLERRHTWAIAALAAACYTLLLAIDGAAGATGHGAGHDAHAPGFREHLVGMWAIFVLSAALVAHFVSSLAQSLRERDRRLAEAREETLRNERIVALGTLGAGAAHELGTPLATMSVLADDMARRHGGHPGLAADVNDLQAEIGKCKRILGELAEASGAARGEHASAQAADAFVAGCVDRWRLLRPKTPVDLRWEGSVPPIVVDRTLGQAFVNLLDNAADASPRGFAVAGRRDGDRAVIDILDDGPGLSDEARARAGEPFFSTKRTEGGMGIGLFLANATVERFGGSVALLDRPAGGCCTRVTLPALDGAPAA